MFERFEMQLHGMSRVLFAPLALVAGAGACAALERGAIDDQLKSGIDFRSFDFATCLDQPSCTVNDVTLHAERLDERTNIWMSSDLYWDPIDGIGVRDGAQNDEIDFDERIRIEFASPIVISGVWISDLFHTEDPRYGSSGTDRVEGAPEDTEVAAMRLYNDGRLIGSYSTIATDRLPLQPFNQEISSNLIEEGDMRRRVVINDETVTLVVPDEGEGQPRPRVLQIGRIDEDRRSIFDGVETVEIDLGDILSEFHNAPLFSTGTRNFEVVRDWARSAELTRQIRETAETKRTSIDTSNGEILWDLSEPATIDGITFVAPFDASNDYSVAGILVGPRGGEP